MVIFKVLSPFPREKAPGIYRTPAAWLLEVVLKRLSEIFQPFYTMTSRRLQKVCRFLSVHTR
jgi:hypothetical protein